jgi:DNA-binding PadR family transcriptional regulator
MEQTSNVVIGGKVINKESVLRVIRDASEYNYAITKALILDELGVKEDKFAMKVLTKLLKQMCEEKLIDVVWTYNADNDYKLSGRGYVLHEDYLV